MFSTTLLIKSFFSFLKINYIFLWISFDYFESDTPHIGLLIFVGLLVLSFFGSFIYFFNKSLKIFGNLKNNANNSQEMTDQLKQLADTITKLNEKMDLKFVDQTHLTEAINRLNILLMDDKSTLNETLKKIRELAIENEVPKADLIKKIDELQDKIFGKIDSIKDKK